MPLIVGKSPKSFGKNVETEMHAGKPLGQSLAIAYNMKKKAKKMAEGGHVRPASDQPCDEHMETGCKMCHGGEYAGGGDVKGVHKPISDDYQGTSEAGVHASRVKTPMNMWEPEEHKAIAKDAHGEVMREMQSMRGQNRQNLAEGGDVEDTADDTVDPSPSPTPMPHPVVDPDKAHKMQQAFMAYAEGGDVEEDDMVSRIMHKRGSKVGYGPLANDTGNGARADLEPNQFDDMVLDDHLDGEADYTGANSGDEIRDEGEEERRSDIVSKIMASRRKKDRLPNPR